MYNITLCMDCCVKSVSFNNMYIVMPPIQLTSIKLNNIKVHTRAYVRTHTRTYTHTYTHACTHARKHTQTHTYTITAKDKSTNPR